MTITKQDLWGDTDLPTLLANPEFREDSVREIILLPILKQLGYNDQSIIRGKSIKYKVGSTKTEHTLYSDYLLKVGENYAAVIEAKSPQKKITELEFITQAYNYASNINIRSTYFALCNGLEFSLYRTDNPTEPILYFELNQIEQNWELLVRYLSPTSFHSGKNIVYAKPKQTTWDDYLTRPMLEEIPVKKRAARRHFGVHPYFTRQSWNVVAEYIKNFSREGDLVLDPYGGTGVTLIEAMMNNRKGINIDINPFAIFLVKSLMMPINQSEFTDAFTEIKGEYIQKEPKTKEEIEQAIKLYTQPKSLPLPKGSDVDTVDQLFNHKQLAQLSLLKNLILKQKNPDIRNTLLLMFSGTVNRVNLTYHVGSYVTSETGFGGESAAIRYYRYRIAPNPTDVDVIKCFELRYQCLLAAKREMSYFINERTIENAQIIHGTATDLSTIKNESVDYIYTDPPYGKKIQYLDLSAMWIAWLDLDVSEEDYKLEAIEGGELEKTKTEYKELIAKSIQEMYRVLKFNRWMSFVFAHKDPEFWHLIVDTAERVGFTYVSAVPQKNGQTSFKKRQNPFTVLSGQLIINFRKDKSPTAFLKAHLGMEIGDIVMQTIEGIIAKNDGATLEQINDEIIIRGLELGFLDLLKKNFIDISAILASKFDYDEQTELFTIKKGAKFNTQIDVKLRVKYYVTSYLRRMERENKSAKFDEIVLYILPLLKNGETPKNQTILSVLEDIAYRDSNDNWRLKRAGQMTISDI
jgi:DNA modification methylase